MSLISDLIASSLNVDVSVLMGANIANEVAQDKFCETTIGTSNPKDGDIFKQLFDTPTFRVSVVQDVAGVELCGALKNVVAIAAGLVDGLKYASSYELICPFAYLTIYRLGDNTKAAVIRIGLLEMQRFSKLFYEGVQDGTFFESCGVADVITTCFGGRNRKVAEAFVRTGKSFDVLEKEMLNGQKLQGTGTALDIHEILVRSGHVKEYLIFCFCSKRAPHLTIEIDSLSSLLSIALYMKTHHQCQSFKIFKAKFNHHIHIFRILLFAPNQSDLSSLALRASCSFSTNKS